MTCMGSQVRVLYRAPPKNLEAIWLQGFSFANPHSSRPLPRSLILPAADTSGGEPKGSPPDFYGFPIIYRYSAGEWLAPLADALIFHTTLRGVAKQLYVLLGMIVGYVVSIFFGMVDFAAMGNTIRELGVVAVPQLFAFTPKFQLGAILSFCLVFVVALILDICLPKDPKHYDSV